MINYFLKLLQLVECIGSCTFMIGHILDLSQSLRLNAAHRVAEYHTQIRNYF